LEAHLSTLHITVEQPLLIPDSSLLVARPLSIRASTPLPLYEDTYFEVSIDIPGRNFGTSLQGGFYVGLCNENFESWDGQWEWEAATRQGVWALHDSFGAKRGQISTPANARMDWSNQMGIDAVTCVGYGSLNAPSGHPKALPGFGNGDRIGFLVKRCIEGTDPLSTEILSMQPRDAEVLLFKNGKLRGRLHSGIKEHELWPFASLAPHQGARLCLHFPPNPLEAAEALDPTSIVM